MVDTNAGLFDLIYDESFPILNIVNLENFIAKQLYPQLKDKLYIYKCLAGAVCELTAETILEGC